VANAEQPARDVGTRVELEPHAIERTTGLDYRAAVLPERTRGAGTRLTLSEREVEGTERGRLHGLSLAERCTADIGVLAEPPAENYALPSL
jgi:hypothetical protein